MIKYINLKKKSGGVLSSLMKNGNKMGTLVPKGLNTVYAERVKIHLFSCRHCDLSNGASK